MMQQVRGARGVLRLLPPLPMLALLFAGIVASLHLCAHAIPTTPCHHGALTSSKCECDPGWSGDECNVVKPTMKTCQAWKAALGTDAKDGEYIIHSAAANGPIIVWCHDMANTPLEYVSLPAGTAVNYAENYERQIPALGFVPCLLALLRWKEGGRTSFTKVRIDPSTLEVVVDDFTFAEYDTPTPLAVGTARDCVGHGKRQCDAEGRARIDVSGTPFILNVTPDDWQLTQPDATKTIRIADSGKAVDITCGGSGTCGGGCTPKQLRFALDTSRSSPCADSPCENGGTCVPGEGGYTCLCSGPWEGNDCSIECEDGLCKDLPCTCEHGGVCSEETNMCECVDGWTGSECQEYNYCSVVAQEHDGEACLEDGECHNLLYDVVETSDGPCVFPFTYKNRTWDTCIEEDSTPPWCSLTKHYDEDKQRGDCLIHASKPFVKPSPNTPPPSPPPPPQQGFGHQCLQANEGEEVVLSCAQDKRLVIAAIQFASYGTPTGTCGDFKQGSCHEPTSAGVVEDRCLGKKSCVFSASDSVFNRTCGWFGKHIAVQYKCGFEVEGEWITVDDELLANVLEMKVITHAACGGSAPGVTIHSDVGVSMSGASSCGDPWWVLVEMTLPFRVTGVSGTIEVTNSLDDTAQCDGDCWTANITSLLPSSSSPSSSSSSVAHVPAPGVYFGTPTTALKRGGELYHVYFHRTWRLPTTFLDTPTSSLVIAVAATETAHPTLNFNLEVFQTAEAEQGVVATYSFDTPINTADGTIVPEEGRPQGVCAQCPTWEDTGISGGALRFDADKKQSIILGSTSALHMRPAWSVAMWVKPVYSNCNHDICDNEPLLCTEDSTSGRLCLLIDGNTKLPVLDTLRWHVRGDRIVHEKQWTHLVFALSNTTATVWVDGYATTMDIMSVYDGRSRLLLGQDFTEYYSGHIDELIVFSRILTQSEVEALSGIEPTVLPRTLFDFSSQYQSASGLASITCVNTTCPHIRWKDVGGLGVYFPPAPKSCLPVADVDALGVSFDKSFTVAAWINPDTTTSMLPLVVFNSNPILGALAITSGFLQLLTSGSTFRHTAPIRARSWTHVALRVSTTAKAITLFVNGEGQTMTRAPNLRAADVVRIGCGHDSFIGWMDDVAFYDHVLDDSDIRALASQLAPKGISAAGAGCDFETSSCTWTGDAWTRRRGPMSDDANHGPVEDYMLQSLRTTDVQCAFNHHTFRIVDMETQYTFDEAVKFATYMGGHLATIVTREEQLCVFGATSRPVYIGGQFDTDENTWKWIAGPESGTNINKGFQNFAAQTAHPKPNLVMNFPGDAHGTWRGCDDRSCSFVRGFIVEFEQPTGQVYAYDAAGNDTRTEWNDDTEFLNCFHDVGDIALLNSSVPSAVHRNTRVLAQHSVHVGTATPSSRMTITATFIAVNQWGSNASVHMHVNDKEVWMWRPAVGDSEHKLPSYICDDEDGHYYHTSGLKDRSLEVDVGAPGNGVLSIRLEGVGMGGDALLAMQQFTVDVERPGPAAVCMDGSREPCYVAATVAPDTSTPILSSAFLAPPADTNACRLRFWYNMRGEQWQSANTCSDFGWTVINDTTICSSSSIDGQCHDLSTYNTAASLCAGVGARLCTLDELRTAPADTDACGHEDARVWSSTPCDEDRVVTAVVGTDSRAKAECSSILNLAAKVHCCADAAITGDPARLDVRVSSVQSTTKKTTPKIVWAALGGSDEWVEATVSLKDLDDPLLPFQIEFFGDFVSGPDHAHSSAAVAVDSISFEGCEPSTNHGNEDDFQIYQLIRRGMLAFALTSGTWTTSGQSVHATTATAAAYAAVNDNSDKKAADADASAYLQLGSQDFNAQVTITDLASSSISLVLNGGQLDGKMTFSASKATFSGDLLGGAPTSVDVPSSLPPQFTLFVKRHGTALSFFLESTLLHSTDVGNLNLHHFGVVADKGVSVTDASVALVFHEDDSTDDDTQPAEPVIEQTDIPVLASTDDAVEHPDGTVVTKTGSLDMVRVQHSQSTSNKRGIVGIRFTHVPLSREDTVTNAYIQFTASATSGSAAPTLTIAAELSRTSISFENVLHGAPMKAEDSDSAGGVKYFLSSLFSSSDACTFIGGTYEGGARNDDRLRVTKYWTASGELVAPTSPTQPVIRYLECRLSDSVADHELSDRQRTTHAVAWQPNAWVKGDRGEDQQTPDLSPLINEVVQQWDWAAGNAISIFIAGHSDAGSSRSAYAFDSGQKDFVPTLHIEYTSSAVAPEQDLEAICVFPFKFNDKEYFACTEDANPLQLSGDTSRPWCGTAPVASERDFGFCTSHLVSTYGGNSNPGNYTAHCAFPFVYQGRTYTDCVSFTASDGRDGDPWCSTTLNYDEDGLWGFCEIPTYGGTAGGAPCKFPFYLSGKRYTECTTDGGRGADRAWCFTSDTTETDSAGAAWGYCTDGSETVSSWGFECTCPPGFEGHRCERTCAEGTYGRNCLGTCACKHGADCNPVTGECICAPGWTGPDCNTPDSSGGKFSCSLCINADPDWKCTESDTQCKCAAGWSLPYCVEECARGMYGKNCQQHCGCKRDAVCDAITGECDCPPGYTSQSKCADPCAPGTFGEDCDEKCDCNGHGTCHHVTGACTCTDGFTGEHCKEPPKRVSVFVNELHYDNAGEDAGEAIEIAGPAGLSLAGWTVAVYSGTSSGAVHVKNVMVGKAVIPEMQGGMGVVKVSFPSNTLQNGGSYADGFALIDDTNQVLQFLSYEGSFVASEGPAKGMKSEDIGVQERSGTPRGYSLQLTGVGSSYHDFSWASRPLPNTFGAVNTNQRFTGGAALETLSFVIGAGAEYSDRHISTLLSSGEDFTLDVLDRVSTALRGVGVSNDDVSSVYIVQARGAGVSVHVTLQSADLPSSTLIVNKLSELRTLSFGAETLAIQSVTEGDVCLQGTRRNPTTNKCEMAAATTTQHQTTTTTATTTTATSSSSSNMRSTRSTTSSFVPSIETTPTTTAGDFSTTTTSTTSTTHHLHSTASAPPTSATATGPVTSGAEPTETPAHAHHALSRAQRGGVMAAVIIGTIIVVLAIIAYLSKRADGSFCPRRSTRGYARMAAAEYLETDDDDVDVHEHRNRQSLTINNPVWEGPMADDSAGDGSVFEENDDTTNVHDGHDDDSDDDTMLT